MRHISHLTDFKPLTLKMLSTIQRNFMKASVSQIQVDLGIYLPNDTISSQPVFLQHLSEDAAQFESAPRLSPWSRSRTTLQVNSRQVSKSVTAPHPPASSGVFGRPVGVLTKLWTSQLFVTIMTDSGNKWPRGTVLKC